MKALKIQSNVLITLDCLSYPANIGFLLLAEALIILAVFMILRADSLQFLIMVVLAINTRKQGMQCVDLVYMLTGGLEQLVPENIWKEFYLTR